MTRRRFYVPGDAIRDRTAHLPRGPSHHLRDVLRLGPGETVEIFDGEGNGYAGTVAFDGSEVTVGGLEPLPAERAEAPLVLAAALIRPARFEWMLEKAAELGVHAVVPVSCRRSGVRIPADTAARKCERWNRIAREAARQCGRSLAPRVHPPEDWDAVVSRRDFQGYARLVFHERAPQPWEPGLLGTAPGGVLLCTGPEGGWEEREIAEAVRAGFRACSLGRWTLRAETAAVAALAVVGYHIRLRDGGM